MKDATGEKHGRLTAIRFVKKEKYKYYWLFRCDCGNEKIIKINNVRSGNVKSCGCLKKEYLRKTYTTHGEASRNNGETREYRIWLAIKTRCFNKKQKGYKNYGGRGITICKRWFEYKLFLKDMGRCPDGYQIERINNNKGYYPRNCKWVSRAEQCRNRRTTKLLTDGKITMCLKDWANILKINEHKLKSLLKNNKSINGLTEVNGTK